MTRKPVCLAAMAVLALVASCAFGWNIAYLGDVEPNTLGSCGESEGISFYWKQAYGNTSLGSVVNDPDAIDGRAYRINDNSTTNYLYWRTNSENIDSPVGATIVARVKCASDTNGGGNIGIRGSLLTSYYHWGETGGLAHVVEPVRGRETVLGSANDGQYHILRLVAFGNQDFRTVPYSESFTYANGNLNGVAGFSGTAGEEISIVNNAVQVAANGSETTAGVRVRANPDAQGKVRITCNLKLLAGGQMWCTSLKVYDSGGRWIAGWMARDDNNGGSVKGRVGGAATALHLLQTDADGSALEMIIDVNANVCEYIVDGDSLGTLACPQPPGPAGAGNDVDRLEFSRFNDTTPDTVVMQWDDLAMNGIAASGRTVRLYLDENPTPVVEILNAAPGSNESDCFLMGTIDPSGASMQDVYFDWVVGTAAGAFAPGEEQPVLGYALPIPNAVATTIQDCMTAPPNTEVYLSEVQCAQYYLGAAGGVHQDGFLLESPNRECGIRVVWRSDSATLENHLYNVHGTIAEDNGERVIIASFVEDVIEAETLIDPLGIGNGSGGGAFGIQGALVKDARAASGNLAYSEPFAYSDGKLVGKDSWLGNAGNDIAVASNTLKISGGLDNKYAERTVYAGDCGTGTISVKFKARSGAGGSNYWHFYVKDNLGNNLAEWMGSGTQVVGKCGAGNTGYRALTGGWDTLEVRIKPAADQTWFYFNNTPLAQLQHPVGAGDIVAGIRIARDDRYDANVANDYVSLDDIEISPSPTMSAGLSPVGLFARIYGNVTAVKNDSTRLEDNYFYVDDGSGVKDGSGHKGVRCRPTSVSYLTSMPNVGDYVSAYGILGATRINGVPARFLWTWQTDTYRLASP